MGVAADAAGGEVSGAGVNRRPGGRDLPRPTEVAWRWVGWQVRPGETVVDATAGNGLDTVFLAGLVGAGGRVVAFDVQAEAVAATRRALAAAGLDDGRVRMVHGSHERLGEAARPGEVAAVMANLGYLPGGDHGVTTGVAGTLAALDGALGLLRPGGVITVVGYPGHPGGAAETKAVIEWAAGLEMASWRWAVMRTWHTRRPAPVLVGVWRR